MAISPHQNFDQYAREEVDEILRKGSKITNSGHARQYAGVLRAELKRFGGLIRAKEKRKAWEDLLLTAGSLELDIKDKRSDTTEFSTAGRD